MPTRYDTVKPLPLLPMRRRARPWKAEVAGLQPGVKPGHERIHGEDRHAQMSLHRGSVRSHVVVLAHDRTHVRMALQERFAGVENVTLSLHVIHVRRITEH